jgi:hypothetical protein
MSAQNSQVAPLDPLRRYSIQQSLVLLSTSRASLYKAIKSGKVKTISEGKRRFLPGSEIARLCAVPA